MLPIEEDEPFKNLVTPSRDSFMNLKKEIHNSSCVGFVRKMSFEGINLKRIQLDLKKPQESLFTIPENSVFMCFVLEGKSQLKVSPSDVYDFKLGMHNIFYFPKCKGRLTSSRGKHDVFILSVPIQDFKDYLPTDETIFCRFRSELSQERASCLRHENGAITHQIYQIIEDLCQSNPEEEVKRLFIRAKVFELLSVQLQNLCSFCSTSAVINRQLVEKMYAAKEFMTGNLGEYYSLKSLAKKVGTNEYTLKKEFKTLFGDTVFGFWNNLKMDKAQELLIQNEKSIAEISEIVGYKNPQHFSTAFKRKFKIAPSTFRKNYK